jgi:hypothetical protein
MGFRRKDGRPCPERKAYRNGRQGPVSLSAIFFAPIYLANKSQLNGEYKMPTAMTLLELAKRTHNGSILEICEALNQSNPIMQDAVWREANGAGQHVCSVRTNLPAGTWRRINKGVPTSVSGTEKVTESLGMLEDYSEIDGALLELESDPIAYRSQEDISFIEGMGQTYARTLFYGNPYAAFGFGSATDLPAAPEKFYGLAPRYNALSNPNVYTAAGTGTGTLSSIYVVQWGLDKVFMAYPKGHASLGIQHRDLGEQTLIDADGNKYQGVRSHFKFFGGLVIRDTRCVKRVVNIAYNATGDAFEGVLVDALNALPYGGAGAVIYCNRSVRSMMDKRASAAARGYTYGNVQDAFGMPVMTFFGKPVKICEVLPIATSTNYTGEHQVS